MLFVLSRQNQLTLATLSDGRRAIFYGAFGVIALLIAGSDELFSTGGGTLLWILLLGRLGGGDLADLDRRQHLLSLESSTESARLRAPRVRPCAGTVAGCRHGPPAAQATGRRGPPRSS